MSFGEILGLFAGLLTTGSVIPQVIKVYKLKSAKDISLLFNILFLGGGCLWLSYGVLFKLFPVILWNSLSIVLFFILLVGKFKYGKDITTLNLEKDLRTK